MDVVAATLDQVLGATGEEELAAGDVAQVPRVESGATEEPRRGIRIAVVTGGRGGAAEFDAAFGLSKDRDLSRGACAAWFRRKTPRGIIAGVPAGAPAQQRDSR